MTQTAIRLDNYREGFEALEQRAGAGQPEWLRLLRAAAWNKFNELGFPTARRGNERWKYTNVRPLAVAGFESPDHDLSLAGAQAVRAVAPWHDGWRNIVFLDGRYSETLSAKPSDATGITVTNLAQAIASNVAGLRNNLGVSMMTPSPP